MGPSRAPFRRPGGLILHVASQRRAHRAQRRSALQFGLRRSDAGYDVAAGRRLRSRYACAAALLLSCFGAGACGSDSRPPLERQVPVIVGGSSASAAEGGASAALPEGGASAPLPEPGAASSPPRALPPTAGAAGAAAPESGLVTSGNCCEAQPNAGCGEPDVQRCVCAKVASCCQTGWDVVCAQLVEDLQCGSCKKPCCEASDSQGCADATVEACVCAADPSCCSSDWDPFCVTLVDSVRCSRC